MHSICQYSQKHHVYYDLYMSRYLTSHRYHQQVHGASRKGPLVGYEIDLYYLRDTIDVGLVYDQDSNTYNSIVGYATWTRRGL